MKFTIECERHDVDGISNLHELEERYFPSDRVVTPTLYGYKFEVTAERAAKMLDELRLAGEDPAFNDFDEEQARADDQANLPLSDYGPNDPIHATAG